MALSDMLKKVPEYWPFPAKGQVWKKGDKFRDICCDDSAPLLLEEYLADAWDSWIGLPAEHISFDDESYLLQFIYRPIPQEIREAEAWYALWWSILGDKRAARYYSDYACDVASPFTEAGEQTGITAKEAKLLGGEIKVLSMLSTPPGALMRWVVENTP